jgi:hypothetical protein
MKQPTSNPFRPAVGKVQTGDSPKRPNCPRFDWLKRALEALDQTLAQMSAICQPGLPTYRLRQIEKALLTAIEREREGNPNLADEALAHALALGTADLDLDN